MKHKLDFLKTLMIEFEEKMNTFINSAKLPSSVGKLLTNIQADWDNITRAYNEISQYVTPVDPLDVKLPKKFSADLIDKWQFWKDYLVEQHGICMKSRMEIESLKRLMSLADDDPKKAIQILELAIATGYKNFFSPDKKDQQNSNINSIISSHENDLSKY